MIPQILVNVPLTTTLLSTGFCLLFMLWYVMPRDYFAATWQTSISPDPASLTVARPRFVPDNDYCQTPLPEKMV
jgi:hypothetical protein